MSATETFRTRSRVLSRDCGQCKARKRRIEGHLATFRTRSRPSDVDDSIEANFSNNDAVNVDLTVSPSEAAPGDSVTFTATANLTRNIVGQLPGLDPDACTAANLTGGVDVQMTVTAGGNRVAQERFCLPSSVTSGPGNERSLSQSFSVPSGQSQVQVSVDVEGRNSGNFLGSDSATVSVVQQDTPTADPRPCPTGTEFNPETNRCEPIPDQQDDPFGGVLNGDGDNGDQQPGGDGFGLARLAVGPLSGAVVVLLIIVLIAAR